MPRNSKTPVIDSLNGFEVYDSAVDAFRRLYPHVTDAHLEPLLVAVIDTHEMLCMSEYCRNGGCHLRES